MKTVFKKYKTGNTSAKFFVCVSAMILVNFPASAQEQTTQAQSSVYGNPLFMSLLTISLLLLFVIAGLAEVVKAASKNKQEKERSKRNSSGTLKTLLVLIGIGLLPDSLSAQSSGTLSLIGTENFYWGMDGFTLYFMLTIIAFEILIVWALYKTAMDLMGERGRRQKAAEVKAKTVVKPVSILEKLNASVAVEAEADILLDHNYDGIRELDNDLPPWWKYGFYATIVFAVIYLIHFHVTNTGKLQLAEYEEQISQAKLQMEEYRKKAANLVDENNVTLLSDEASINSGRSIFMDNCAACHGRAGEGGVGPNLTDDYWLHEGGIKDIFKTIKYGWPEKGMKSWQQDLGAKQIHEVSSFIKSLRGTNPPNAKEKQGELYNEGKVNDSTKVTGDSMQVVIKNQ